MTRFADILQETNDRLDLPQPTKSHIVLEVAADLDDLFQHYISQGCSESEAIKKTKEKIDLSDGAIKQLARIHEPPLQRFMDRLSEQGQAKWEGSTLLILLLFVVVFTGPQLFSTRLFALSSKFSWPVLVLSVPALFIAISKFYQLYIKKDHNIRRLRSGLTPLITIVGANMLVGICGYVIGVFSYIKLMLSDMEMLIYYLYKGVLAISAMLILCIVAVVVTALIWFILSNKIKSIEQAEVSFLLNE